VLNDLERQTYSHFEVIIVDQSEPFQEVFYQIRKLQLRVWYQEEKALWKARNEAILAAKGSLILLYDDDSRIEPDWIMHHLKAIDFFNADISSGVSVSNVGSKVPVHYSYFRWSDQLDTGNVLIKRHVFEKIGLFDQQFEKQRMGDGEFGLRAYLAGFRNISNPFARRIHLKVGEGGLRQMGSWDGWRPKNLFAPRPIPSVLYLYRKYFGTKAAIRSIMTSLIVSLVPYKHKGSGRFLLLIILLFPVLLPFVLIQVLLSWHKSSQKLIQGPIIAKIG
jgi:GT2 family glycosyltransferase